MNLLDLVRRPPVHESGIEGEKIPWHEPAFSARMLQEHLSQSHDMASRRSAGIDRHVAWIDGEVLTRRPARILDLGCGPGLYAERLARLGHECVGIDFSPASIEYAREQARRHQLSCSYREEDLRTAELGLGFDLALMIFGELNVFTPGDVRSILQRARAALSERGSLLLEPHTLAAVREIGEQPPSWLTTDSGLFSERPHLCLREGSWDESEQIADERYFIVDAQTGETTRYGARVYGYTDSEYRSLLRECGFENVDFHPSLDGTTENANPNLTVILARA
jgi:SAM-dependent methyltransferase